MLWLGRSLRRAATQLTTTAPSSSLLCTPSAMTTIPARLARTTAVSASPTHARQRVLQLYRDWYRGVRRPAFLPPPPSPWTHPRVSSKHCNQTNILPLKNFLRSLFFPVLPSCVLNLSFLFFCFFVFVCLLVWDRVCASAWRARLPRSALSSPLTFPLRKSVPPCASSLRRTVTSRIQRSLTCSSSRAVKITRRP